ncbi:MAG: hypothetical protein WBX25_17670 [Rhodomicrobium sp.]
MLPLARDQAANAARVEDKGAGLRLDPEAPEEAIAAAVNRLLSEPRFRAAARRLGDAIQADIDGSALVTELETMVTARRGARMAVSRAAALRPRTVPVRVLHS